MKKKTVTIFGGNWSRRLIECKRNDYSNNFDGTLHTGPWPEIGAPAPYAVEVMNQLKSDGHYLIIWTCRENAAQTAMVNWLLEKGIPFDRINEHKPGSYEAYGYKARKVYAHLYIDDKQVGGLPMWNDICEYVNQKEAEYQKMNTNRENSYETKN